MDAYISSRHQVVIAGGGAAALETAMALRAHARGRVSMTLVAPEDRFRYRPLSVREPFGGEPAEAISLRAVASDLAIEHRRDALAWVAPRARKAYLTSGDDIGYDSLVIAIGGQRIQDFEHAISFRGPEDRDAVRRLVEEIEAGDVRRVAFVIPAAVTWPLPLYELALMTARRARDAGIAGLELTIVTPEQASLAVFGQTAAAAVGRALDDAGVRIELARHAAVPSPGAVVLHPGGEVLECDRVVALAAIAGVGIRGLPGDGNGFIPVDEHGRVDDLPDVYAAGDATAFPVKQGGLACEQADAVAEMIAARAGAPVVPTPFRPILRGQLLTGGAPYFLRTDLSGCVGDQSEVSREALWWPPAKVASTYLAPYIAARDAGAPTRPETGVVRRRLVVVPADGRAELEVLGFERDSRN